VPRSAGVEEAEELLRVLAHDEVREQRDLRTHARQVENVLMGTSIS
jgi:hypothetical protein